MRQLPYFMIACATLFAGSPALSAMRKAPARRVELISMTSGPAAGTEAPLESSSAIVADDLSPLPAAFQVHDLSRRYVQFRMQQELATAAPVPISATAEGVAPTSSIHVPAWMRGNLGTFAPVAYRAGCSPIAYQPAGFLDRSTESRRAAYYGMMNAIACEHGIPAGLFDAMIIRESGYNPGAISRANAYGLAQLMPDTAIGLGVNRYDPVQNLRGGARYLRQQLDRFGQVHLALAAYNAGPGRVRGGMVPRISETQAYVTSIIANWSRLTSSTGSTQMPPIPQRSHTRSAAFTGF